jgi:DNA-binding Lrp family transcriptional regulator
MLYSERKRKAVKDVELRLIAELMKNSRRSDRELAKVIGVSQPTISRTIKKLEKEGIIKEYTMIPDFSKLGYEMMAITSLQVMERSQAGFNDIRRATMEAEKSDPHAGLMIVNGIGHNKNRLFIDFYENYSAYVKVMEALRRFPFTDVRSVDSFFGQLERRRKLSATKHVDNS